MVHSTLNLRGTMRRANFSTEEVGKIMSIMVSPCIIVDLISQGMELFIGLALRI
jgi:hypothetical protein